MELEADAGSPGARRADGRATADQLISAAERLFSERGVDVVSLREVGKAAASRNTAAAQYHFGGKEGLVRAIVARRAPRLNERRMVLLDAALAKAERTGSKPSVPKLVGVLVLPLVEEANRGSHYVGFLSRLAAERHRTPWVVELDESSASTFAAVAKMLSESLPGLDRQRFARRRDMLVQLVVSSLAAHQHSGPDATIDADFVRDLLEAAVGILMAPVGAAERDPRVASPSGKTRPSRHASISKMI